MPVIAPFFREAQTKRRRRLPHHTTQPAPPLTPPLELLDEEFIVEWWNRSSPSERRAVQQIISDRLSRIEFSFAGGEAWILDAVIAGCLWYQMRRRVVSELVGQETDLAEMIYQMETSKYEL